MSSTHASTQRRFRRARLLLAGAAVVAAGLLAMPQLGFAFASTISATPSRPCGEDAPWSVTFSAGPTNGYGMELRYQHGVAYSGWAAPTSAWSPWMAETDLYGPITISGIPADVASVSIVVRADWRSPGSEEPAHQSSDWTTVDRPDATVCPDTTTTTTTTTIPETTTTTTTTIPETTTTTTTTSTTTTTTSTTVPPSSSTTEPPASTTTTPPSTTTNPPAPTTTSPTPSSTSVPGSTVTTVVDTTSSSTTVPVQQGGPVPSVSTTTVLVAQPDDDPDPAAQLPATGGGDGSRGMVYAAGVLLLAGSGAVAVSRRRHTA